MPEICPRCGATNQSGRSTCAACGAELDLALFAEMFGPPPLLKNRYAVDRAIRLGDRVSLYRATDRATGQACLVHQVALTRLTPDRQELVEHRFLQQATAWRERRHPNLIEILDADVQHHRLYLITAPIRGRSLRSIARDRAYPVTEASLVHWAQQLCDALDYLHSQDPPVVLGCLSPAAIHIDDADRAQIIEVGLIRYDRSALAGPARGVPGYAAPEQRQGELTPRSDLYSLGIILYALITRLDPRQRPLQPLQKHASGFSEPVLKAIARSYRRDPEKRFASAFELRWALGQATTHSVPMLPPFELAEGMICRSLPELVKACASHWEDGLLALITGRIAAWLQASAATLRQAGQHAEATQLDQAAERAIKARQSMDRESDRTGASGEIARNAAYASWLQALGAVGIEPRLRVAPARFDFGILAPTVRATSYVQIRNQGQGYLSGRVESRVPWITVPGPTFGCHAGKSAQVRIVARGRALSGRLSTSRQALHIVSNGGTAWIEAQAASSPPALAVSPATLDFGPITRGTSRVAHLTVANEGGGRLTGKVIPRAPWLRVRHPDFSCPAGASAQVMVELLSQQLPKGAVRIRRAIAIDSDSGQGQIDVRWKWARPALDLDTTGLDFGSLERGTMATRTVVLSNSGTAELVGTIESSCPWLSVAPAEFRCAPGASLTLSVRCDSSTLPGGSSVEPEALTISANAGVQTLSASVEVLAPRLVVEPALLDLGTVQDGDQIEDTFVVGNRGSLPWQGRIEIAPPWLLAEPRELSCDPGHFMPVSIMLDTTRIESGGTHQVADAIRVVDRQGSHAVGVRLTLARPELSVARRALDFGLIGRTDVVPLPLTISNSGTGVLEWQAIVRGTWLEIVPNSGTCQTGESVTVQVNAYALAVDGESGQAWVTLHSNAGRVDLPASVALSSPRLAVEPLHLELHSKNYAPAVETVRVTNRGVGRLTGTVSSTVPWLTCAPQTFDCNTGAWVELQVEALLQDLREGTVDAPDALHIESNAGSQDVSTKLSLVLYPELHVSPKELVLDRDAATSDFWLENRGFGPLRLRVTTRAPWISIDRRDWTIKVGKRVRVRVALADPPPKGSTTIDIDLPDGPVHLPVRIGQ